MPLILTTLAVLAQTPSLPATLPPEQLERLRTLCTTLAAQAQRRADELQTLATCYFRGDGLPQDLARARSLYEQAAAGGYTKANCAVGNMMIAGQGGPRDIPGGLAHCRRAAEAGDPDAQTDLGGYLLTGEFTPKDVVEARRWLTMAATQRQANAAFLLGQIYWNGDGVTKSNAEAARWWHVAYDGGRADAAFLLAREAMARVLRSTARPQDVDRAALAEALRWFDLAAETDPSEAKRQRAREGAGILRQLQSAL